jgi:hypothetical protein
MRKDHAETIFVGALTALPTAKIVFLSCNEIRGDGDSHFARAACIGTVPVPTGN